MFVNFNILNQLGSPAINSNTFANRPAAGQTGRLFVSTDTFEIYRDNGTTWDLIGGPGSSTITGTGTATQVAYFTSSQAIGSSANLYWDNTNTRLGVGTATPGYTIEANGAVKADRLYITGMVAGSGVVYHSPTINAVTIANYNASGIVRFETNGGIPQMNIDTAGALSLGNGNTAADTSSILDIGSTTRGFLQPRMTTAQRNLIATPATGLTVYNTSSNTIDYYNGTSWISLSTTTGTVNGTGTATQVAFWSASSTISGSNNLYWDNVTGSLGVNTNTPGAELDVHGTGTIAQFNTTAATGNVFLAIQRSGTGLWRIGDTYNGGSNFFELHNTSLANNAIQIAAATNKSILTSLETYSTGVARGNLLDYTLSLPNGTTFTSPNTVTALGATLNLNIAGSATIPAAARSGADFFNGINFTSAGTFTVNQSTTIRAFSNVTAGWAFNGSAVGTVTHLAGLRVLFPTNSGSAINVTDNYALLINNQNANTGTITYTNRWGIYQEGSSDLNYMAANLLLGSTVNTGEKLQVTGTASISSSISAASFIPTGATVPINGMYLSAANQVSLATSSTEFLRITSTGAIGTYNTLEATSSTSASVTIAGGLGVLKNIRTSGNIVAEGIGKTIAALAGSDLQIYNTANSVFSSINNDTSGNLRLQVNGGSLATAIQIQTNANVLIGTTTDAGQKLQVAGSVLSTDSIEIKSNVPYLELTDTSTNAVHYVEGNDNGLNFNADFNNIAASSKINFYIDGAVVRAFIDGSGNFEATGSLKTGAPTTGTAANWKLGSRVAATVVVNTTEYIEVDIGGTLYKLATVT